MSRAKLCHCGHPTPNKSGTCSLCFAGPPGSRERMLFILEWSAHDGEGLRDPSTRPFGRFAGGGSIPGGIVDRSFVMLSAVAA